MIHELSWLIMTNTGADLPMIDQLYFDDAHD